METLLLGLPKIGLSQGLPDLSGLNMIPFLALPNSVVNRILRTFDRLGLHGDTDKTARFVDVINFYLLNPDIFPAKSWYMMMCDFVDENPDYVNILFNDITRPDGDKPILNDIIRERIELTVKIHHKKVMGKKFKPIVPRDIEFYNKARKEALDRETVSQ